MHRLLFYMFCLGLLSGCLSTSQPNSSSNNLSAPPPFALPPQPELSQFPPVEDIQSDYEYDLAELIHLAQTHNPATRIAWQEAEQAALAAGMVKATYLPMITASVVAGRQSFHTQHNIDLAKPACLFRANAGRNFTPDNRQPCQLGNAHSRSFRMCFRLKTPLMAWSRP